MFLITNQLCLLYKHIFTSIRVYIIVVCICGFWNSVHKVYVKDIKNKFTIESQAVNIHVNIITYCQFMLLQFVFLTNKLKQMWSDFEADI